jgi:hypothetical protein
MKLKIFGTFFFFMGLQLNFLTQYQKAQVCVVQKFKAKKIQKFVDPILYGMKKTLFFTSNSIILQSMWSIFLKLFLHIILLVQIKILWSNLKKEKLNISLCNLH